MLTWDLIDHLNLAMPRLILTNPNVCFATLYARNALVIIMDNVKAALMDITCQEQLATSVMLTVLLALEVFQLNVADAQKVTFWMSQAIAQSRSQILPKGVENTAIKIKLDGIMY